ncbi:DHA2 family efflux MFS transporter permease subunit [Aeromicrobium sp. zg-Y1362]|uniref:DHA2 family efflux MFS transporter permease subunit n=2 Tax=Aeromicrobium duanguangcaii TaxID=2968086 RepID=A0ABY5KP06_9ACTN|nr:DHA2 family efflux MFS transporter permease subunit [Aeromicrobium duanguangcaii]MCD9155284.1 DHA2 family efflux MFS transporter permease subunit [Aeromicrobium duanguangcaii]MCL3838635.1 DHA2 family efflux MFS transporter permease subunit [Aeromicrobium duanguangcaii]UUI70073.1 DHA2 family efflux MFS transporter permease subunit [Aeromicrobium duanguangcaii]
MVIGFFMILVDSTIVSVATPAIRDDLATDYNAVIWVTSAYLLAYAVPLLITGRLGDRLGPKRVYLVGLTVFTLSSLWCGLTGSVEGLILARVFQGLGASMMTPQTMAVITRTFPADSRGRAMALWGATAGVATLVGPVLGGVLVDQAGWEWIFFINVPVGIVGFVLAWRLVPRLETHTHSFDWLGVALSAVAMFLIVFGIQEGEQYDWGTITGWISVPLLIAAGLLVLAAFLVWQARNRREPLLPLALFRDRNFSVSNVAISTVSFSVTAMAFPFMLWTQTVLGYDATQAGLLFVPMAVVTAVMAPMVGRMSDRMPPRRLASIGFGTSAIALLGTAWIIAPDTPLWQLLVLNALLGFGNAFLWAPLASTATRNLPMSAAGAGSGVYNTTRQVGAVLGSAAIAAAIAGRLAAHLPGAADVAGARTGGASLPEQLAGPFSDAMSEAIIVPALAFVVGLVVVQFFAPATTAPKP